MPRDFETTARVVNVRPRLQGDFAVLVGVLPSLVWFTADPPPKLGELVVVRGEVERVVEQTTVLRRAQYEVTPEPFARRQVSGKWRERVLAVVKGELKDYQVEGAAWLASRLAEEQGGILADEPGLGKTRQTIAAVLAADVMPCLIIGPAILRHNHTWLREINKVAKWPLHVLEIDSQMPLAPAHFVVTNYEIAGRREADLLQFKFRSLVCDEAHAVKNAVATGAHRAAVIGRIAERIRRVALLTGSPIPNQVAELWRLLSMVEPGNWGTIEQFRKKFCTLQDGDHAIQSSTGVLSRVEEFHALIGPCFLRRQKDHVLDLPPKRRRVVRVTLDDEDMAAYQAAHRDVEAWLKELGGERGIRAAGRATLLRLTYLRRIAAMGKMRKVFPAYVHAWIRRVKRPLVVFGYHQSVMASAANAAARVGARVGILSATVKDRDRSAIIDAFDQGAYDVLCCPLRLAGVGLNLQYASDCLFLERYWTPAMMDQAESRCHRIGVKREVVCTYFDAVGTIDEYIAYVARSKQKLINHAVGDAHAMEIARRLLNASVTP